MAKYSTRKNPHGLILLSDLDHSGSSGGFNVQGAFSADFRNYVTYFALSNDRDGNTLNIVSIGSVDLCPFGGPQLAGYVAGNDVIVRV